MASVFVWLVGYLVRWAGVDLPTQLLGLRIVYLGLALVPLLFLIFTFDYTNRRAWVNRYTIALLSIVPVITIILTWTSDWHTLFWTDLWQETVDGIAILRWKRGIWSSINAVYSFLPGILASILLVSSYFQSSHVYRRQIGAVMLGTLVFWVNALISTTNTPIYQNYFLFFFPLGVTISSVSLFYGIFGLRLLDILPIAQSTIISSLDDSVIVLDAQQRLVDLNPSAQRLLGWSTANAIGKPATTVLHDYPPLLELCCEAIKLKTEWTLGEGDTRRDFDVSASPLTDQRGKSLGQVIVFREITERKRSQMQLLKQQRTLATLEERERLVREMHDNIGQVLGYVNVQTQVVRELLAIEKIKEADEQLARLGNITRDAHTDVREYIFAAKNAITPEQGLIPVLEQYIARFDRNYDIRVEFDGASLFAPDTLPLDVQEHVVRIIQESFNNVRKHSGAKTVSLSIAVQSDVVEIVIRDDGRGFDTAQSFVPGQHFGQDIMRERACEIGAQLNIESMPGHGTRVLLRVPLQGKKR